MRSFSAFDSCRNLFDAAARWQGYCCMSVTCARTAAMYMMRGFINRRTRLICSTHMWLSACAAECRRLAREKPLEPKPHARTLSYIVAQWNKLLIEFLPGWGFKCRSVWARERRRVSRNYTPRPWSWEAAFVCRYWVWDIWQQVVG